MNRDNHANVVAEPLTNRSKITWAIFISFLVLGSIAGEILSHWLATSLAYEISFFSLLLFASFFRNALTESEEAFVVNTTTYFGLYLAYHLFQMILIKPLAIGVAAFLFGLTRDRVGLSYMWGCQPVIDDSQAEGSLLRSITRNLLLGIAVCGISILIWQLWDV